MERRLLLAIALMIGVMLLSNVLFPPVEAPAPAGGPAEDSTRTEAVEPPSPPELTAPEETVTAERVGEIAERVAGGDTASETVETATGQIVTVRSDLYEYRFDTRGARLVGATMRRYPSFAEDAEEGDPVELVREGDALLSYRIAAGGDTVSLRSLEFTPSETELDVSGGSRDLTFSTRIGDSPLRFQVTYRFEPERYRIGVSGELVGLGGRGHTVLVALGRGIEMNEANEGEDVAQMAVVARSRTGDIRDHPPDDVEDGEAVALEGGPFSWAAAKSKYFLAALVSPESGPGFGGVLMRGVAEPNAAEAEVALPVPAGSDGFALDAYVGPQDFSRLQEMGQELHNVNPYGWSWLRWFIRPFGNLMMAILIWMHQAFSLAYGWVLILFGVLSRIILFPLYQISMRQQMKQMAIQPEIKRIQKKYKEEPQKLQQEMMKVYKEHGINPLGGCLPMLLPFPILITLFFVFQNTIELRGVPFLWLPDLSLPDPLYLVPLLMGLSMLLLNWIGQRGMETNPQMKMFTYVLPVVFTFMFAQFAAGLNLYYAASNVASLPQQLYLSKERRRARPAGAGSGETDASSKAETKKSGGGPGAGRRSGGSRKKSAKKKMS